MSMKIIKFDLPINGTKVKNLEELRDNLTDEILVLARSSQLERWFRTRQLPEQAKAVATIVKENISDKGLFLVLCKVLEVEAHPDDVKAIFDASPAPGNIISGAKYFQLYEGLKKDHENLKKELDKKSRYFQLYEDLRKDHENLRKELDTKARYFRLYEDLKKDHENLKKELDRKAKYFHLYEDLKKSIDKKEENVKLRFKEVPNEVGAMNKIIKNIKFDHEFVDAKSIYGLNSEFRVGNVRNIFVKQFGVVAKGSLIMEIEFHSSLIRIYSPMKGVVAHIFVGFGSDVNFGADLISIAEAS